MNIGDNICNRWVVEYLGQNLQQVGRGIFGQYLQPASGGISGGIFAGGWGNILGNIFSRWVEDLLQVAASPQLAPTLRPPILQPFICLHCAHTSKSGSIYIFAKQNQYFCHHSQVISTPANGSADNSFFAHTPQNIFNNLITPQNISKNPITSKNIFKNLITS